MIMNMKSIATSCSRAGQPLGRMACLGALALATIVALPAWSQEPPPGSQTKGDTPRSAVEAYLTASRAGDYESAATYLDLRSLPPAQRSAGPTLARQLKAVLDRTLWVDLDSLSDEPEGNVDDELPPHRDIVGTIQSERGPVDVLVENVKRPDGQSRWQIAGKTVAQVSALYRQFGYGPLAEVLPQPFFEVRFLEVQLWQWIGLLVLAVGAAALAWLVALVILRSVRAVVRRHALFNGSLLDLAVGPLRLTLAVAAFSTGEYALALAVPVHRFIAGLEKALTIVAVAWLVVRLVDVLTNTAHRRFTDRGQAAAAAAVPLGRRTLKVVLVTVAVIAMLQNFGFNVTGLIAALGVGGLAVALAAQKTIENLFGGVTLISDQPVRVGDFCRFGDRVGTVEDIGLRSTRVRTLDRTVVSIPNAEFSGMQLENFARRDRIWLQTTIGLRYETTPDQLRYVLVELKKLLLAHPKVHPDPARARLVGFGPQSLDVEIFAYVLTTDINEFLAVREDIFLRIMDIVAAQGGTLAPITSRPAAP